MVVVKNDNFDHDHITILSSNDHGQMVKVNGCLNNFNNFNKFQQFQKISTISTTEKSEIVKMFMIKFVLTILAMKIL